MAAAREKGRPPVDMTGKRYGKLTVLARAGSDEKQLALWLVQCECGVKLVCVGAELRRGVPSQCHSCYSKMMAVKQRTHGETGTYLHELWMNMRRRCYDKGCAAYKRYGGRGITVHDRWREDYTAFAADIRSEIGERPSDQHSLDRTDNSGNYKPGNVRWATRQEQMINRRKGWRWGKPLDP